MNDLKTKNTSSPIMLKTSRDFIVKLCTRCHQSFLAKYWDNELDWYIELNPTAVCGDCQKPK